MSECPVIIYAPKPSKRNKALSPAELCLAPLKREMEDASWKARALRAEAERDALHIRVDELLAALHEMGGIVAQAVQFEGTLP